MSMDIYTKEYVIALIVFLATIWWIKLIFSKKLIIDSLKSAPTKRKFVKKHIKGFNIVARTVMIILVLGSIFLVVIPAFKDFKNYINGQFNVIKCKTLISSNDGIMIRYRTIQVINIDTSETIELKVKYTPIEVGEYYTIEYLPNMRIGKILSKDK